MTERLRQRTLEKRRFGLAEEDEAAGASLALRVSEERRGRREGRSHRVCEGRSLRTKKAAEAALDRQ